MGRRTKIVATIGPASHTEAVMERLVRAGMDVARINLSHGTLAEHTRVIKALRRVSDRLGKPVAVMVDLPGPKLRLGRLAEPLTLAAGQRVTLGPKAELPVNFPELVEHFAPGEQVLVDDGAVGLRVVAVAPGRGGATATLEVENPGVVSSHKGVNLPDTVLPIPAMTAQDRRFVEFAVEHDVDYVALSFVRHAEDVRDLKEAIGAAGGDQLTIAKIEKKEALAEVADIIAAADAVMVARGDLGVEIPPAEVPIWQKRIIHAAIVAGRSVITATQMLQSMIDNPRPTRAEASDVANAIYDSSCAVMLSGETAVGQYPVEAVATMAEIATTVEADIERVGRAAQPWGLDRSGVSEAISFGACDVAFKVGAAAIVTATASGATARAVAKNRPPHPIVAVSHRPRTVRQLALVWGVTPLLGEPVSGLSHLSDQVNDLMLQCELAAPGDIVVLTAGLRANEPGATNLIKAYALV
jgi:pyruvate kinase